MEVKEYTRTMIDLNEQEAIDLKWALKKLFPIDSGALTGRHKKLIEKICDRL